MSEELFSRNHWDSDKNIIEYIKKNILYEECKGGIDDNILEIVYDENTHISSENTSLLYPFKTIKKFWENFTKYVLHEEHNIYNFVYMRHSFEKQQNPQLILDFFREYSTLGYIETTSPIVECCRRIQKEQLKYRGHILSRYIIWVDPYTDILKILPKYPIIEYLTISEDTENNLRDILQKHPHYWNTYYIWTPNKPIKYLLYEHGINFDIERDYHLLLKNAIDESVKSTNKFLSYINKNINIFKDRVYDPIPKSTEA